MGIISLSLFLIVGVVNLWVLFHGYKDTLLEIIWREFSAFPEFTLLVPHLL